MPPMSLARPGPLYVSVSRRQVALGGQRSGSLWVYCIRFRGSANMLTIEAPIEDVASAVGTCLDFDGEYVATITWPS